MTAFGAEVDLDRLADFVGGALDGTPEADEVRHLVDSDARWASAYSALVVADSAVRDELGALGSRALQVPDEVVARLDAALAGETPTRSVLGPEPTGPGLRGSQAHSSHGPDRTGPGLRGSLHDLGQAREERRRRRHRWTVGLATAAAVIACGVVGVGAFRSIGGPFGGASDTAARNETSSSGAGPAAPGGSASLFVSGNDYNRDTLGQVGQAAAAAGAAEKGGSTPGDRAAGDVPQALERLRDPAARAMCLDAIVREYGGRVTLAEFARFEGAPALIVLVDGARAAAGRRWVVVVGPTCGLGGAIADERYHGPV